VLHISETSEYEEVDWPNAQDGDAAPAAKNADDEIVPAAARANVEPSSETIDPVTDMLGQLQEAQREGQATPQMSRRATREAEVYLETPHADRTRRLPEAGDDYANPDAIRQAIHDFMSNGWGGLDGSTGTQRKLAWRSTTG
jgi:hypothetical protein